MAAERARVQQRRGGLRGPGGRDRGPIRSLEEFFPVFRAHPLLFQTLLSLGFRLAASATGFERLAVGRRWAWRPSTWSTELGRLLYGRRRRPARGPADGADALPRGGHAPGPAGRTDDALRDAHAAPAGPLRRRTGPRCGSTPPVRRMGLTFLVEGDRASSCSGRLRLPGADPGAAACGCATWPSRWAVMAPGDRAVPAQPDARRPGGGRARTISPGSSSGGPTTTGSSTRPTVPEAIGPLRRARGRDGPLAACAGSRRGGRRCSCPGSRCPVVFFQLWPVKGFQYLLPIAPAGRGPCGRGLSGRRVAAARRRPCSPRAIVAAEPAGPRRGTGSQAPAQGDTSSPGPEGFPAGRRRASGSTSTSRRERPS